MAPVPYYNDFKLAVERVFNSWTALQLAVEHGMGGQNGRNTAMEVMNYMTEYCCANDRLDPHDLCVVLDELMDEEFETWCQDNSTQEVANLLSRYIQLCRSNMQDQMNLEVSQLPPCKLWLCKPQIQYVLPIQPNEVIHDDDIDEEDENSDNAQQDEPMDEDVDPGWTVVKTKKKH
ncbi:pre-rRNA-processing protein TSR2 homolog [Arctopsyche grandis]|uniref:pre-rRNA-processing protein TSR2 homolog n=1 Tax=Arctopsyche grandis TaxID=121162 RepID=UPI00406D7B21